MIASSEVACTASLIGSLTAARISYFTSRKQHVLSALLPANNAVADRLAAEAVARLRLLELRHPEHLLAQLFDRDLEKHLVVKPMNQKQARRSLCLLGDHRIVRLDLRPATPQRRPAGIALLRRVRPLVAGFVLRRRQRQPRGIPTTSKLTARLT